MMTMPMYTLGASMSKFERWKPVIWFNSKESSKKSSSTNGQAIKKGGGNAGPSRK